MMKLYVLPPAFGLRNTGPFAFKCELALLHLKLEFELLESSDPRTAPKGKMPYMDDGGTIVADSELILQHIDRKTGGGLYGHLTDRERADGLAFTRLAEEHLYWIVVGTGILSNWESLENHAVCSNGACTHVLTSLEGATRYTTCRSTHPPFAVCATCCSNGRSSSWNTAAIRRA